MKTIDYLSFVPAKEIAPGLREAEDRILAKLGGDVFALQATYRLICRALARRKIPPVFADLPVRLRYPLCGHGGPRRRAVVSSAEYSLMLEQVEAFAMELADARLKLPAIEDVQFKEDPDRERARRVERYAKFDETVARVLGPMADVNVACNAPRPIFCVELGMPFKSIKRAAKHLEILIGVRVKVSHLRTAMKRGQAFKGYRFRDLREIEAQARETARRVRRRRRNRHLILPLFASAERGVA